MTAPHVSTVPDISPRNRLSHLFLRWHPHAVQWCPVHVFFSSCWHTDCWPDSLESVGFPFHAPQVASDYQLHGFGDELWSMFLIGALFFWSSHLVLVWKLVSGAIKTLLLFCGWLRPSRLQTHRCQLTCKFIDEKCPRQKWDCWLVG